MSGRELKILWWGIALIVMAIIFPPYGYDQVTMKSFYYAGLDQGGLVASEKTVKVPWRYVSHSFILSPPAGDPRLDQQSEDVKKSLRSIGSVGTTLYAPFMGLGWHILLAEIAVISLIIFGAWLTVRSRRK